MSDAFVESASITQSIGRLEARARAIVKVLRGRWSRRRGICCCPAHDDRTPSLSVTLGTRAILFHCFAGCPNEAVLAAMARIGVKASDLFDGQGGPFDPDPRIIGPDRNALRLWKAGSALSGSPAEAYLRSRAITVGHADLRFHACTPLGPKGTVRFLPAMLAAVRTDIGILGVHRTFLEPDGSRLAKVDGPKRALGNLGTGAVRLGWPFDGVLGLAEGIENALSASEILAIPCWATLGNVRFGTVSIPESVTDLHLCLDADAGGELAEERARRLYADRPVRLHIRRPEVDGTDWNDVLRLRREVTS